MIICSQSAFQRKPAWKSLDCGGRGPTGPGRSPGFFFDRKPDFSGQWVGVWLHNARYAATDPWPLRYSTNGIIPLTHRDKRLALGLLYLSFIRLFAGAHQPGPFAFYQEADHSHAAKKKKHRHSITSSAAANKWAEEADVGPVRPSILRGLR